MAATPSQAWLPPLNSHQNSAIHVSIRELKLPEKCHVESKLKFEARVDVVFYSEADVSMQKEFRGLSLWKSELLDATTQETLAASLRADLLHDDDFIPFPLDSCWWKEEHGSPPLRLSGGRDELAHRISGFVVNNKVAGFHLEIKKTVRVPAAEFASWISWLEEQKRADVNFWMNYIRAITIPRAALEGRKAAVVEVVGAGEEGRCMICLEEFGGGVARRLPCRHRFHEECISRWLKGNSVCPVCRHQLRVADDYWVGSTRLVSGPTPPSDHL